MVASILHLATGNGNQTGGLLIGQRLPSSFLPLVCEHRLDATSAISAFDIADGLFRDTFCFPDLGIAPSLVTFEQNPSPRQRSGVGFTPSDKDLEVFFFIVAELDWCCFFQCGRSC